MKPGVGTKPPSWESPQPDNVSMRRGRIGCLERIVFTCHWVERWPCPRILTAGAPTAKPSENHLRRAAFYLITLPEDCPCLPFDRVRRDNG